MIALPTQSTPKISVTHYVLTGVENYTFEIDLLLVDSGFYIERVIRRALDIAATVVHVSKNGE